MAEKDTLFDSKLKQVGLFDFKEFYSFLYDYLVGEGYNITEKVYNEKVGGDSRDLDIEWEVFKKISDYFKFTIKIKIKTLGMKSVEAEREGKKIKINQGTIEVKFKAILEKDYESKWENSPLMKFLRGIYDKYIIRERADQYEEKLISDVNEIIAQCKAFLK